MTRIQLQVVSPERTVLNGEFDSVSCPTTLGQITILPGHAALVATLQSGELITRTGSEQHTLHVAGGFVHVQQPNKVVILADAAEHLHEIDEAEAEAAYQRARDTLRQTHVSDEEYAMAAAMLERSLSRLHVVRKHAHRRTAPITSQGILEE